MRIGILGSGPVGQCIGARLIEVGHAVMLGSRSAAKASSQSWVESTGSGAWAGSFADAAQFGDLLFNCTRGDGSVAALTAAGPAHLADKVVVDLANPLDFASGSPPSLFVGNTDSLGERLQRAVPRARIVKALNTMACTVMVNPRQLAGAHVAFLCGNDPEARSLVAELLLQFGWQADELVDLGDLSAARATEAMVHLWLRLSAQRPLGAFNFALAPGQPS